MTKVAKYIGFGLSAVTGFVMCWLGYSLGEPEGYSKGFKTGREVGHFDRDLEAAINEAKGSKEE